MATINTKRTRSERVASLQLEPTSWSRWSKKLFTGPVVLRFAIAALAALGMLLILEGWEPPFVYREGHIPARAIVSRVAFEIPDVTKTAVQREQKRREVLCYYENNPQALRQLRGALMDQFHRLGTEKPIEELDSDQLDALLSFIPGTGGQLEFSAKEAFAAIRVILSAPEELKKFETLIRSILEPLEEHGLLKSLGHDIEQGNQRLINVYLVGQSSDAVATDVTQVRYAEVAAQLPRQISERFQADYTQPEALLVAKMVSTFLIPKLPVTLTYHQELSEQARKRAEEMVKPSMIAYFPTVSTLARAGYPLTSENDLPLLRREHEAWLKQLSWSDAATRAVAFLGMITALYLLCGVYIYYQFDRSLITDIRKLLLLLGLTLVTSLLCRWGSLDPWRAEIVPLVICAFTSTIAHGRQLALLISTCLALAVTLALGFDLGEFVVLASGTCSASLFLGRIRTRTRLISVGLAAGAVVALTHLGVDSMLGQLDVLRPTAESGAATPSAIPSWQTLLGQLAWESSRMGLLTLCASALMQALLPFVERIFSVQTDLSLLELGDASNTLLRQLAQRAPGTYNHSINVAAIAEAAAESIGAHGLLTRVGAYFHDIGKMLKPNYFVENQSGGGNRHDALQPAMSTLVIIAHVKDGSDLARKHRLPQPLIDFIEQHHGTTLVEYFYREATKRSQEDPYGEVVSETSFRYPGPKPQTLEAAVLMLADTVESASRSLVEPTPARIQNLVDQIAMKKLLDGQFDQCGLTLQQLDCVKLSLVKTLTAIYHGRVKYPGQQTA